ncbi:MAG TPA: hypothetical protein VGB68_14955 [Pyrinomonadaceae bacterium]|jgi:hypothetical protein
MFCPGCGLEERQSNQFCRACGTDLRQIRFALERPDNITASAVSARDEIGRAVAAKIRETQSARELKKVAEDVLPAIEKFLESPEEKRLRRVRSGVIVASIGIGAAISFFYASLLMADTGILLIAGAGAITFFIGLSLIINALFFTVPRKSLPDNSIDAESQRALDRTDAETNELLLPESNNIFSSVTEHTTQHLREKQRSVKR